MSGNFLKLFLVSIISNSIALKCNEELILSDSCFDPTELIKYADIAKALEKLDVKELDLLSEAGFVVGGNQYGTDLYMGHELSKSTLDLQFYGNTIITFLDIAVHHLSRDYGISRQQVLHCFKQMNLTADKYGICKNYDTVKCDKKNLIYQPLDGMCTSPNKDAYIGAKNTPFNRLLGNAYEDSIHEVRASIRDKSELPSARLITSGQRTLHVKTFYNNQENLNNDLLVFFMKIGIFDIIKTLKEQATEENFGFDCCDLKRSRFSNYHCLPIEIPAKDRIFKETNCMNYIRAMVTHDNCKLEASILNTATHFMDLSFIYNPNNVDTAIENDAKFPDTEDQIQQLISIGDERITMLPQLHTMTLIWIRFHNEIAQQLHEAYPKLSSAIIFFETRRLVIAVYQSIWLREILPLLLTDDIYLKYKLDEKSTCYDLNIDPVVSVEFSSVVARHFHKFIYSNYTIISSDGSKKIVKLGELYQSEINPYEEFYAIIKSMLQSPYNTDEFAGNLFENENFPGIDLKALDLQAERDFGVPGYLEFLYNFDMSNEKCIKKFSDLREFVSDNNLAFLKYAYYDPHDIDLSVGADMQTIRNDAILSEIFEEIFANQIHKLKCGDPYFYTNALNEDQIAFVEEISFSDVLCIVSPNMSVQSFAFLTPGTNNTVHSCNGNILQLDDWKLING